MPSSVCILGLGKSGVAAANHALAAGAQVTIYAGPSTQANQKAAAPFEQAGVTVHFDTEEVRGPFDLCVASPGIPQTGAFYASAQVASAELISEPEYAWRISPQDWIAVTGTNGKTTTVSLTAHLLNACAIPACACGNIGDTALGAVEQRSDAEVLVAEMSSYQLASTVRFRPRVAVLLNITPDHLSWHGSHEAYVQAKLKLFANLSQGDCAVLTSELASFDEFVARLRENGVRVVLVGAERDVDCAFMRENGMLCLRDATGTLVELCCYDELLIKGEHNVQNALCAAAAAQAMGAAADGLRDGLRTFSPLEHRIEPAGIVNGVEFFNDSKATNVDATLKALAAFEGRDVILLLGGRDKGTDLSQLVQACEQSCSYAICYGEAGQCFYEAFAHSRLACERVAGMREAFALSCEKAHPGDVVLLSPACASFDEFDSFNQRGSIFKELVRAYSNQE